MHEERAVKGFFITTGTFADTAIKYAKENNIELINLKNLASLMNKAFGNPVEEDNFRVICLECGGVVTFSISTQEFEKLCDCGCIVRKNFTGMICRRNKHQNEF